MKNNPLISVIIPVFNTEKQLERCLNSITSQSYKNLEIIVIDNGSCDSSPEICDAFEKADSRIKVFHQENKGLSNSRNRGIALSHGEYIAFVDSDDFIYEDMLLIMLNRIEEDSSDMAICNRLRVGDGDIKDYYSKNLYPIDNEVITQEQAFERLSSEGFTYYVNLWGKLYKRELFNGIEFPEGRLHEDVFVIHLLFEKCSRISCIRYAMYYWYNNPVSITHSFVPERLDVLDAYLVRFEFFMNKGRYAYAAYAFEGFIWNYNNLIAKTEPKSLFKPYKKRFRNAYLRLLLTCNKSAFNKKYISFCIK